jgi:uncharacterized metal-binding protein
VRICPFQKMAERCSSSAKLEMKEANYGDQFTAFERRSSQCMNESQNELPIVYSCSGCSDAGELADRVARQLNKEGVAQMSCLAGIGGRVKPLLMKAQKRGGLFVADGCPLNCARHTLLGAGFKDFDHVGLHELGHRKGACPALPRFCYCCEWWCESLLPNTRDQIL